MYFTLFITRKWKSGRLKDLLYTFQSLFLLQISQKSRKWKIKLKISIEKCQKRTALSKWQWAWLWAKVCKHIAWKGRRERKYRLPQAIFICEFGWICLFKLHLQVSVRYSAGIVRVYYFPWLVFYPTSYKSEICKGKKCVLSFPIRAFQRIHESGNKLQIRDRERGRERL